MAWAATKATRCRWGASNSWTAARPLPKNATLAAVKRDRVFQRLIGNFGFSDVGRSFDGVHYAYATPHGNFTFIGAVPTRGVFQVDGWGWNRIAFTYTSYTREWGSTGTRCRHPLLLH